MKTKTHRLTLLGLFLFLALILDWNLPDSGNYADSAEKAAKGPEICLACHGGSFDKLVEEKGAYKTANGETVNPHQYIPHNEKKAENVPDCLGCHSEHPVPHEGKVDLSKVNLESCYISCHHQQNFDRCSNCHKDK
jgi:hypothetical protein